MSSKRERVIKFSGVYFRTGSNRPSHRGKVDQCFDITYKDHNGKKVWEKIGWKSEGITATYASQIRSERIRDLRLGQEVVSVQQKRKQQVTFGEIAVQYLTWADTNKKSAFDDRSRHSIHLKKFLDEKNLSDITPLILEQLKTDLFKKGLSPATVKHCLVLVRQIFNKAIAWDLFTGVNPITKITLPKLDNKRTRFLEYDEAILLLKNLSKKSKQLYNISLISLLTGMRFNEIVSLTWSDIDLTNNIIQIRDSKHGDTRQSYMTQEISTLFVNKNCAERKPTDLLFPNARGEKQKKVSHSFMRTVTALGFNNDITDRAEKVVFHTLRHTFASWLAIQGTPIYTIKELMGHKTIEMTERYAHLLPDTKRKAMEQLTDTFTTKLKNRTVTESKKTTGDPT